ncbi:MAG: plastocyanin/azurin family copper-binding protein [Actinomycetota bacterium]
MSKMHRLVAVVAAGMIVAPACGGTSTTVTGRVRDFAIELDASTIAGGDVTFEMTNEGPSTHELVVQRSTLDPAMLPTLPDVLVDAAGACLEEVGEIAEFAAGTTASETFALESGTYVYYCNVAGHYAAGMHGSFTVE